MSDVRTPSTAMSVLVSLVAAAALAALLIALGSFNWPAADDFCNHVLVETRGYTGALHWLFFEWSGRVVTGVVLYAVAALVDIPALRAVSMVLAAGLVLVAWQITLFVVARPAPARWPLFAFILAALTLGLYPLLGQTVYWPTGGIVYLLPLILLLHWLLGARALLQSGDRGRGNMYWFAMSFAVGNAIELILPIVASYAGVIALRRWRTLASAVRGALLWRAAGLALGAAVLIGAPGNYLRANATPGSFQLDPAYLVQQYAARIWASAEAGATLLAIAAGLIALPFVARLRTQWQRVNAEQPARAFKHEEAVALLLGAALSLTPVLAAPLQFAPRNGLYALVCVFLAALLPAARWVEDRATGRKAAATLALLAVVGTLVAGARLLTDMRAAEARRPAQLARDQLLREAAASGRKALTVAPIAPPAPVTMHAVDITPDPAQLVNWCVATYYHLGSVALEARSRP
ncbi:MAG: DUF6056 family protein [Betaproteobacteria bacterium]